MNPFWRVLPLAALLGFLLFAGLKAQPVPQTFANEDKLYHLLGFAALGFVAFMTFVRTHWLPVLLGCLLVGLGIELGQALQPLRTASPADMAANALGVLLGWACSSTVLVVWRRMRTVEEG